MPIRHTALLFACLGVVAIAGCRQPTRTPVTPPPGATAGQAPAAGPQGDARTITGAVLETMDAASYTYVRVGTPSGDVWAASQQFPVKVGDRVVVPLAMPMENFHSASLNRDFTLIYFTTGITREGAAGSAPGPGRADMMASHATAAPPAETIQPMTPPAGATSIADVWATRKALAGKSVTVRGKVVKFNGGILDRNWLHLQDGTGTAADGSNDLTVTTPEDVKVGDIVTVTGTVAVDKDFTAGYAYPVIVENARVIR